VTFFLPLLLSAALLAPAVTAAQGGRGPTAAEARGAAREEAAEVLLSEGDTRLVRGGSFSTPVRRDEPIRSGDLIRTGADGRVQLRFADGALMSIAPDSDFRVEDYVFDTGRPRSFFELMQGSVRAVSGRIGKRDPEAFRLRTPTATIGIRGTEFVVTETVCPAAGCAAGTIPGLVVTVVRGRVSVRNEAGAIEVPAGATLRVRDARTVPALATARRPASAAPGGPDGARRVASGPGTSATPPAAIDPGEHGFR